MFNIQTIIIGYLITITSSTSIHNGEYLKEAGSCLSTNEYFVQNFNYSELKAPQRGNTLRICQSQFTCCSTNMEKHLQTKTGEDFETHKNKKFFDVEVLFEQKYITANNFFLELIENSKTASDVLLFKTYGKLYSDNSQPFMDIFANLKNYYIGSAVDIEDIFDNFFTTLTQRVFKMLNPSYLLDEDYMQCISDNFIVIEPFGDMPVKLSMQIQRAFVVARTFVKGLDAGRSFAEKISKMESNGFCSDNLLTIQHCSKCEGFITKKPCHNSCLDVLNKCMEGYSGINLLWNEYIDVMQLTLDRLAGPFNIESLLDPMDVKMSEAIMVLQNNKNILTKTVFDICGQPKKDPNPSYLNFPGMGMNFNFPGMGPGQENSDGSFSFHPYDTFEYFDRDEEFVITDEDLLAPTSAPSRKERSIDEEERKNKKLRKSRKHNKREQDRDPDKTRGHAKSRDLTIPEERFKQPHPNMNSHFEFEIDINDAPEVIFPTSPDASIMILVEEMKEDVGSVRDFWKSLPLTICDDIAEKDSSTSCSKGSIEPVSTETETSVNNKSSHNFYQHFVFLRTVISDLKQASHGYDPQLPDDQVGITGMEESSGDFSGSGEGSGFEFPPRIDGNGNSQPVNCPTCGAMKTSSMFLFVCIPSFLLTVWRSGL